jgi:hypothetical protein
MAIINQYKAIYPIENTRFETESKYVNASSMKNAIEILTTQYGEPKIISKTENNVLTETYIPTTVNFQIKSYFIDDDTHEEVEVSKCIAYPTLINNAIRGNTVYLSSPNYQFVENVNEEEFTVNYTFEKWMYDEVELSNDIFTIPLDESITEVVVKAIYERTVEV